MNTWDSVRKKLKTPLGRVGLGTVALGWGAVALWPTKGAIFDPEKALVFVIAVGGWLYAELFPEADEGGSTQLSAHDQELAAQTYTAMPDHAVRFLRDHDFGNSWVKQQLDPVYRLADLADNPTSEFTDGDVQEQFVDLSRAIGAFTGALFADAGPIGNGSLFNMIPERERQSEQWSDRTVERVRIVNELADELSRKLTEFYRLLRRKGANLLVGRR